MQSKDLVSYAAKNHPVLPHEQQLKLLKLWQAREDERALEKLILSNIKAVYKEASKLKQKNHYISYDDLVQEGIAGLLKAANMFDSTQDVAFLTYAMWWIKANMRRYIMDYRSVVRMGTTRADRAIFSNLSKAIKEQEAKGFTGEVLMEKVAKKIGVKRSSLNQMMLTLKGFDVRLDTPVGGEEGVLRVDLLEDAASLESLILKLNEDSVVGSALSDIISSLPEDESYIIRERFMRPSSKTLRDLAKEMNISREWVRKLEIKALDRIRKRLISNYNIKGYNNE